ncbi:MAG: porin PorA family protein, partial [Rhodococcus sp. (in: high G+C Gram-positive bacteria)]
VYQYQQTVGPVDLSTVVNLPTNKVTLPADTWGVEGGDAPVTMTRWYENTRTLWVEPETGVVVKGEEQIHQYYAREAGQPEVDVLNAPITFDENTVEYQIQQAKDGQDQISLFGRTVPIIAGILGVISLIAGVFLLLRGGGNGGHRQPARTDTAPRPTPGGGAAPAPSSNRDWTTDRTEEIPRTNLNKE